MAKLKLADYIQIIDRMLERDGLAEVERDAIFNDPINIEMISARFHKRTHPREIIKELDRRPIEAMYASLDETLFDLGYIAEAKKKPTTKTGKDKKFKKVMGEFGKGKLTPYHAKGSLKSKKQGGSKQAHKQALAIAFSEAGMSEAFLNEAGWDSFWDHEDGITVDGQKLKVRYYVVYDTPHNLDLIVSVPASEIEKLGYDPVGDLELWSHGNEYDINVREIDDADAYYLVTGDQTAPPLKWKSEYTKEEFENVLIKQQAIMNKRRKLSEAREIPELTDGQKYAVDFLSSKGLQHISSATQLRRGTLMFKDPNDVWNDQTWNPGTRRYEKSAPTYRHWALYKTGYVRTGNGEKMEVRGKIRAPQYKGGGLIDDDEYMELAHLVAEKINSIKRRESKKTDPEEIKKAEKRASYQRVDELYKMMEEILDNGRVGTEYGTRGSEEEKLKALQKLYKRYFPGLKPFGY